MNSGVIIHVEKPQKKKSMPGKFALQGIIFTRRLQSDIVSLFVMSMRIIYSICNVNSNPSGYCRILLNDPELAKQQINISRPLFWVRLINLTCMPFSSRYKIFSWHV